MMAFQLAIRLSATRACFGQADRENRGPLPTNVPSTHQDPVMLQDSERGRNDVFGHIRRFKSLPPGVKDENRRIHGLMAA